MNRIFSLLSVAFIFFLTCNVCAQSLTRKVLFLGNSYTYVNDVPSLTTQMATSTGDQLIHNSHTPGGYFLIQHAGNTTATSLISGGDWDYVMLQEQSQQPAFSEITLDVDFTNGAAQLRKLIKQYHPCAQPIFYMTWGRQNGDALNCPQLPQLCTYVGMDSLTRNGYIRQAKNNNAEVSPVGVVWHYIRDNYPALQLYDSDGSHPSAIGSYLAACCHYTAIFKKNPQLITYNFTLSATDAAIIRNAVKTQYFDHLSDWNFMVYPASGGQISHTNGAGAGTIVFQYDPPTQQPGSYAHSFTWDFGDGTTATNSNASVSHTYTANGTYTVTLTVSNCDMTGVHQQTYQTTVNFTSLGIADNDSPVIAVSPNPTTGMLTVSSAKEISALTVENVLGETVYSSTYNQQPISVSCDLSQYPKGIYFVKVYIGKAYYIEKIVLQ